MGSIHLLKERIFSLAHKARFNSMPYEQDTPKLKWFQKLKIKA